MTAHEIETWVNDSWTDFGWVCWDCGDGHHGGYKSLLEAEAALENEHEAAS